MSSQSPTQTIAQTGTLRLREEKGRRRQPSSRWPARGAEAGCGAGELSSRPLAALRDVVFSAPGAFSPPPTLRRSQGPGAGEARCPTSVSPLGSSQSQCGSPEASGRDANPRAARSPQRCPLLASARRSRLLPRAASRVFGLEVDGSKRPYFTARNPACRGQESKAAVRVRLT